MNIKEQIQIWTSIDRCYQAWESTDDGGYDLHLYSSCYHFRITLQPKYMVLEIVDGTEIIYLASGRFSNTVWNKIIERIEQKLFEKKDFLIKTRNIKSKDLPKILIMA